MLFFKIGGFPITAPISNIFEFDRCGQRYRIDVTDDIYGVDFWKNFATKRWEPDTQSLIEVFIDENTYFLDIGAAHGCMSILAAASGAKVSSFEPNPKVFAGLCRNLDLNPNLKGKITPLNKAVSDFSGQLHTNNKDSTNVLSPIVFTEWRKGEVVDVVSLIEVLESYSDLGSNRKLVVKMDIEGAEWKLLNNLKVLNRLKSRQAVLILALHPGLHRPVSRFPKFLPKFRHFVWNLRNLADSWTLFGKLSEYSGILRSNLVPVRRRLAFCLLILAGNHEFVLDFDQEH